MKLDEFEPLSVKVEPQLQDEEDDDDEGKAESKATNASEEGVDIAEDAAEEKESGVGGKKKGTRKKRSLNWEEAERGLLLEVIKPKVEFVENRSVDAKSIKSKRLAWTQITKQFNALNFRHRMLEQIQVQWRSMKNSAKREHQQKHPKSDTLDGMRMIEFMEELQKEPVAARSQTRHSANAAAATIKKELLEMDEDEDMPLAALPNSTNASEDTLQTSTIAIPSPPPSTAGGDSQQETCQQSATPPRGRKKTKQIINKSTKEEEITGETNAAPEINNLPRTAGRKRQRQRKLSQAHATSDDAITETPQSQHSSNATTNSSTISAAVNVAQQCTTLNISEMESKYKQELFRLMKQARLAEMDYFRREHEQKLRFEQMEQELKLKYYRQQQDLKLRQLREEHDTRMRYQHEEHQARLGVYSCIGGKRALRSNALKHNDEGPINAAAASPASLATEEANTIDHN